MEVLNRHEHTILIEVVVLFIACTSLRNNVHFYIIVIHLFRLFAISFLKFIILCTWKLKTWGFKTEML